MKRHEMWRQQYRAKRYMDHLTDDDLRQRAKDIYLNILVLSGDVKIGLVPLADGGSRWIELFTHVFQEFKFRFGPYPAGFTSGFMQNVRIPNPSFSAAPKAAHVLTQCNLQPGTYLVKYGKFPHISAALKQGAIRVFPASSYDDPSLNPAIRDKELELTVQPHPSNVSATLREKKTVHPPPIEDITKLTITQRSATDYYVYCLSSFLAPRHFLDFDYDACLIITQPKRFLDSLQKALAQRLPKWLCDHMPVSYIDPLIPSERFKDVFRSKHFRYEYQKEYRLVCLPPAPIEELTHVDVELGNLEDYCELISL